jgi:hypothetical protein
MIQGLFALLMVTGSHANAAEYRSITISNGRSIPAEVKDMTATEITLDTPQGIVKVPSADLQSMDALTAEAYAALEPWTVVILPFTSSQPSGKEDATMASMVAQRILSSIPNITPKTVDDLPDSVGESAKRSLALCETDLQCAVRHGQVVGADVVVMGQIAIGDDQNTLSIGAVFIDAPAARKRIPIVYQESLVSKRMEIAEAQYRVLFLEPSKISLPEPVVTAPTPTPESTAPTTSNGDMAKLVWAPIPGITAIKQGDAKSFATALGVVGVGTAASVYVAGHATYSAPQMTAMTVLSSYGLTVLANHIFMNKK